jgi:hypothetical protein
MVVVSMTSRQFNQDTASAKRAAATGPVFITDRGQPSHVLLSYRDYERLVARHPSIVELLAGPQGVGDIDFDPERLDDAPRPLDLG